MNGKRLLSRVTRAYLVGSLILVISGCAGTTDFSGFSRGYNEAAEDANNEQLLLNIMRASHRAPYQFTALQTATGSQSLTGGLSLSVASGGRTGGATAGGAVSTTLATAIVDTQDFYNGMSRSIPLTTVNNFLQDSPSNAVLFNLFFDRIVVTRTGEDCKDENNHLNTCEIAFHNNPRSERDFKIFQIVMQYLFMNGLTTEAIHIDDPEAKEKSAKTGDDNSDSKPTPAKPDPVHLCFKPQNVSALSNFKKDQRSICKAGAIHHIKRQELDQYESVKIKMNDKFVKYLIRYAKDFLPSGDESGEDQNYIPKAIADHLSFFRDASVEIALPTRSTLHVIEYLGAVASAQLNKKKRFQSLISTDSNTSDFHPCDIQNESCSPLLVVHEGNISEAVTTHYRGREYSVPDNPDDLSLYVLGVVRQLIALNTSSKDLPTPAVLTTVP